MGILLALVAIGMVVWFGGWVIYWLFGIVRITIDIIRRR